MGINKKTERLIDLYLWVIWLIMNLKWDYLMGLIPAVLVPRPQPRPVIEQSLTAGRFTPCQHSVVQRGQATAVLIVWRGSEGQESLERRHTGS